MNSVLVMFGRFEVLSYGLAYICAWIYLSIQAKHQGKATHLNPVDQKIATHKINYHGIYTNKAVHGFFVSYLLHIQ